MEDNNVDALRLAGVDGHEDAPVKHPDLISDEPAADLDAADQTPTQYTELKVDTMAGEEASTISHEGDAVEDDLSGGEDDESDGHDDIADGDDQDTRTETCLHDDTSLSGPLDNEVERHDINPPAQPIAELPQSAMIEASKTALFRRYSKMTPAALEEQERNFHEDAATTVGYHAFCPEPTVHSCQNPVCVDQLRWRDARIAELQAALDHMTEAMAIQQRDMASQRVFLSRQAEQLTKLSNKLHQDKVALHVERERFQKTVALTPPIAAISNKLKPAAGKLKSPVKKLFSAASSRRASFTNLSHVATVDAPDRSNSGSQLRRNPLVSDASPAANPIKDRSSSLSVLDLCPHSEHSVIAVTPTKDDAVRLVDVKLHDGFSPVKSLPPPPSAAAPTPTPTPVVPTLPELDLLKRTERVDSSTDLASEQKKQSLGDRLRSMRWGRS